MSDERPHSSPTAAPGTPASRPAPAGLAAARGVLWTAALSALAGFAAVYAWLAPSDNAAVPPATSSTVATAAEGGTKAPKPLPSGPGANPLSTGQVAGFVFKKTPEPMERVAFVDGDNTPKTLADWKGRTVLLNLWATWCGPCRKEMPALDRLQKALGSDAFEVVALAIDRGGIAKAKAFLDETKVANLKLYVDPTAKLTAPLKVIGLPTTILIKDGQEIGRLVGPAEWDAPEAQTLIRAVMGK